LSEFKVRGAKVADEEAILALVKAEMQAHVELDERFRLRDDASSRYAVYIRDRMRDIDSSVFVAETDRIVGLAIGTIRKVDSFFEAQRYGYISDLMVERSVRRRGFGRALFDRAELWFRSLGIDVVRLHVAVKSDEARAFWKSIGASEFLLEAWIDLGPAPIAADETPAAVAGDEAEPPRRSGFDYPDDVLTGPGGTR
jgi:GNAT superfamily N-acetyltransferase